ncbi:MAG: SDR family NAD(P)-dependent oxidoreductase [Mobilicoccus sp.]|nr:SDR family NAD(P)-dependent oxidoreductase [Mobilicoccus sp.]
MALDVVGPGGAVVTGAGGGLGEQIARVLIERGHTVLVADVDFDAATRVASTLGVRAIPFQLDVRDADQVEQAAAEIITHAGRLAVWINNAGVLTTGPAWEQSPQVRARMIEVNSLGLINGTVAAIGAMRDAGGGHILNIVSLAGLSPVPGEAVYAASKHAALGFSLSTNADLRLAGIRDIAISCICPDGIWTPMLHDRLTDPDAALSFSGELFTAEQVAEAVRRVLDSPRPVTALPRWRGILLRVVAAFPGPALRALPLVMAQGRRTQRRILRRRARV